MGRELKSGTIGNWTAAKLREEMKRDSQLIVMESDSQPIIRKVNRIIFPTGSLSRNSDGSVNVSFVAGGGSSPGGSNGNIQFNSTSGNDAQFSGASKLSYNNSTNAVLSMTGSMQITGSLGLNTRGAAVTHGITLPNETSDNSGMIKATAYLTYSSIRYKENIKPLEPALPRLNNMRPVSFEWKDSGKKDIGFIVEEVEKELPEVIGYDHGVPSSMDYAKMTSFLMQCIKEQQLEIKELKRNISEILKKGQ